MFKGSWPFSSKKRKSLEQSTTEQLGQGLSGEPGDEMDDSMAIENELLESKLEDSKLNQISLSETQFLDETTILESKSEETNYLEQTTCTIGPNGDSTVMVLDETALLSQTESEIEIEKPIREDKSSDSIEVAKEAAPENPDIWTDEDNEIEFTIPKRTPKKTPKKEPEPTSDEAIFAKPLAPPSLPQTTEPPQMTPASGEPGDDVIEDELPLPAKGAYKIDFDQFDDPNFNPFETKTKVVENFDVKATPTPTVKPVQDQLIAAPIIHDEPGDEINDLNRPEMDVSMADVSEQPDVEPLPPKGAYKIDFDNFDDPNFNPFETKSNVENIESQPMSQQKPDVPQQVKRPLLKDIGPSNHSQASPMLKKHKRFCPPKQEELDLQPKKLNETFDLPQFEIQPDTVSPPEVAEVPTTKPTVKDTEPAIVLSQTEAEDETLPPAPKGAYNLDFLDNMDDPNFNPFETKTKVENKFETKPDSVEKDEKVETSPDEKSANQKTETESDQLNLDFEPPKRAPPKLGQNRPKKAIKGGQKPALKPKVNESEPKPADVEPKPDLPAEEQDMPLPAKGAYNFDFDKFDDPNFNPFETKTKVVNKFEEKDPIKIEEPDSAVKPKPEVIDEKSQTKSEVMDVGNDDLTELNTAMEPPKRAPPKLGQRRQPAKKKAAPIKKAPPPKPATPPPADAEDEPLPPAPKGAYNLDFLDNLEDPNFNPFETKTKVENKFDEKTETKQPDVPKQQPEVSKEQPEVPKEQSEVSCEQPVVASENPDELNVDFEPPKRAPPKLGQRRPPVKKRIKKVVQPEVTKEPEANDAPLPAKGAYAVDFDKFDDPNYNPFETKSKVSNQEPDLPKPKAGGYNLDFLDNLDDPNYNPFETKSKVENNPISANEKTITKPEESSPVKLEPEIQSIAEPQTQQKMMSETHVVEQMETDLNTTNQSADSEEQFHSASENESDKYGDENQDPNTTLDKGPVAKQTKTDERFDPIANAKAKLANLRSSVEEEKSKRAESISGSSATLTESHVGAFVEHVTGETLRYTARDMEVIRREARIQAEGSNSELEQYKTIVKGMGDLIEHLLTKHQDELSKRDTELNQVAADRDAIQDDMNEMEKSNSHLKSRMTRLRNAVEDMRENEKKSKASFKQYESRHQMDQERYRDYKQKATETIQKANEELDTIEAKKDLELTRAYAEIRLLKTKNESLENQLNLKKDENEELIKICDQLMGSK